MKLSLLSGYGFQYLLVSFFLYLILGPVVESMPYARMILNILLTALLILAVYAIRRKTELLPGLIVLLAVTLILLWTSLLGMVQLSEKAASTLLCLYLGSLVYAFGRYIFSAKTVDANLISAALCLYLLLGLIWGTIYALVESFIPGSFAGNLLDAAGSASDQLQYFYYYSYITMTTLGYGDILPQTRMAAALSQVEAILGQFFTAVLVARLVGIQVSQQFSKGKDT